jgi:cyanophycin synthetase
MEIREILTLKGPNRWSIRRHKLIAMVLDLEDLEEKPTNKIPGFLERLKEIFPSMIEHRCSVGEQGGFFLRVEEGTWMGHVIEHIALEIQTLAGMDVGFGRTRGAGEKGVYNVVFAYMEAKVGKYAAKASVRIAEALISGKAYDLEEDIQTMREIRENERLGPSTGSIVEEAVSRGIPFIRLNKYSLVQLGYGANQKRIQATVSSDTSSIAVELACDKEDSKDLLEAAEVPVPKGEVIRTEAGLREEVEYIGFPLVIKPVGGNHGRGITTGIESMEDAVTAFHKAKEVSRSVIVEKFITGEDYRLLVIDYKLVAASKRTPAHVIGDGSSTIQQLVDKVNEDPRRGYGHEKVLTQISINAMTEDILRQHNYTVETVLKKGEVLYLKDTANLSTGGTATDVFDNVHPYNVFMAERISKIIGLDICGIDIMTSDISKPLEETDGAVLEVNAGPGFRMHLAPTEGLARNVASNVVDMLFPPGSNARIPIIAVAGTNGKTTTTRLIAHMMKMVGKKVGYTTSDGVYIQNRLLMRGDCTGPGSAEFVLKDPTVNVAILESARGGLLRSGLAFDHCDIGIVTNVAADHLGMKGIDTIEQMASVKAVIPETVFPHGHAILNADDDLVFGMRKNLDCNVAFFSMNEDNPRIKAHAKRGGISAIYENGYITICKGEWKYRVEKAVNVPLTFGGKAKFMIQNVLPAVLTGYLQGMKLEDMRTSLTTFIPSPAQTPGRMNMFRFKDFSVLVDYAHNSAGLNALKMFVDNTEATVKVGIIAGVGDRRDEDIVEFGQIAGEMFDEVIIRQDKNLRGRTVEDIIGLIEKGVKSVDESKTIKVILNEAEAITHTIKNAVPGSLITMCSDVVPDALELVMKFKEEEAENLYEFSPEDIPNQNPSGSSS